MWVKVAPKARHRAQIFSKLSILVADTLKTNSVNFFDSATTLKIDPFPYMMGVMQKLTCSRFEKLPIFWHSKLCKICSI